MSNFGEERRFPSGVNRPKTDMGVAAGERLDLTQRGHAVTPWMGQPLIDQTECERAGLVINFPSSGDE